MQYCLHCSRSLAYRVCGNVCLCSEKLSRSRHYSGHFTSGKAAGSPSLHEIDP